MAPDANAVSPTAPAGTTTLTAGSGTAADAVPSPAGAVSPAASDAPKTEAAAPDAPPAPIAPLEIKLPEGWKSDEPTLGKFKALAQESGLKPEAAQKIFDLYAESQRATTERATAERAKEQKAWVEALKNDAEIGGTNFDANAKAAEMVVRKYGSPGLRAWLNESGNGNHPELVRFCVALGKAHAEDSVAGMSGGNGAQPNDPQADLKQRFPKMFAPPTDPS